MPESQCQDANGTKVTGVEQICWDLACINDVITVDCPGSEIAGIKQITPARVDHTVKKEYSNGDVTVIWQPELCIHSGNCVRGLPEVFDTERRPWIDVLGHSSERIVQQVGRCPSGALTIKKHSDDMEQQQPRASKATIEVFMNGPVRCHGPIEIQHSDGRVEKHTKDIFLCRCGNSQNKPFCDGSHKRIGFKENA